MKNPRERMNNEMITRIALNQKEDTLYALVQDKIQAVIEPALSLNILYTFDAIQHYLNDIRAVVLNDNGDLDSIKPINAQYRGFVCYSESDDSEVTVLMHPTWRAAKPIVFAGHVTINGDGEVIAMHDGDVGATKMARRIQSVLNHETYYTCVKQQLFALADGYQQYEAQDLLSRTHEAGIRAIQTHGQWATLTLTDGLQLKIEKEQLYNAIRQQNSRM